MLPEFTAIPDSNRREFETVRTDLGGVTYPSPSFHDNVGATLTFSEGFRSLIFASISGMARATHGSYAACSAFPQSEAELTEVDATSRKSMELLRLRNSLAHMKDFVYSPGDDTEIRKILSVWMAQDPSVLMAYLREELLTGPRVLNTDGKLEAVISTSEETPAYLRAGLAHLFTKLLFSIGESDLQDAAARALGTSRLKATESIPALRKAAERTSKKFLKQQLEKTASDLEQLANGPIA